MSSQPLPLEHQGTLLRGADCQVRLALSPTATVTSLMLESIGMDRGSPDDWPKAVRAQLDSSDLALLGPLAATKYIPDCVLPLPDDYNPSFEEELERIAETPPEALTAEIWEMGCVDTQWSAAARAPRRWLRAYMAAIERAWTGTKPVWQRATAVLERETERVGTAIAKGALDVLLDGLHPRGHVHHGRLYMDYDGGVPATIASGLTVMPMVSGPKAGFVGHRDDMVFELSYPLPGVRRLCNGGGAPPPPGGSTLDALVGSPRASILRRLDVPINGRNLSAQLQLAPSAIAHHLDALERAGLVRREREGRAVQVHRTSRGSGLIALYE